MKVSVVIPAKNEEGIIHRSLNSLLQQTSIPEEVIVVDNNSQDSTYALVKGMQETFRKRNSQLVLLSCVNGNQLEGRQMGFKTAKHSIIVTIDADTELESHWVENMKSYFSEEKEEPLVGVGGVMKYNNWFMNISCRLLIYFFYLFPEYYYFYGSNGAFLKSAYNRSRGLEGCRQLVEHFQLTEPYDDLYLSFQLKHVGMVQFKGDLHAHVLSRRNGKHANHKDSLKRMWVQTKESIILFRFLVHQLKNDTHS